ncbi:MAG TPA: butyrate kinase [Bacillota bacterium]|jgi:butyrate kinase
MADARSGLRVLVINPGSTSTKVAVYEDDRPLFAGKVDHPAEELAAYGSIAGQAELRRRAVLDLIERAGVDPAGLKAVVGRGGLLKPLPSGTYAVDEAMVADLGRGERGEHAANLGGLVAREIAAPLGLPSYVVDPVSVDEFEPLARLSGLPEIERQSLLHALNIKAEARRAAAEIGRPLNQCNLIVAHLGGGISVCPLAKGRMVDVNNANEEGPFSPERAGGLPSASLVRLCFSGRYDQAGLLRRLTAGGGMVSYLGTNDCQVAEERAGGGEARAALVLEAMAYQVAKEIGAMATVLFGRVDAVVLAGGLARSKHLVNLIKARISFIAPVLVYPGEDELAALAAGARRVLTGEEPAKSYTDATTPGV